VVIENNKHSADVLLTKTHNWRAAALFDRARGTVFIRRWYGDRSAPTNQVRTYVEQAP